MYDIDGEDQSQEKASSVALVKNGISYVFYADHMVLGAKLARYKVALEKIANLHSRGEPVKSIYAAKDIARNALKDGV